MKRRAYIINSTIILLLIPLMLLLATYEDVSSQITSAQSERMQIERTYGVVSSLELDFQRGLEISGKRALVTVVNYIAATGNFLDPRNNPANVTIHDLILFNEAEAIPPSEVDRVMRNQTLKKWLINISTTLEKQGYIIMIGNIPLRNLKTMSSVEVKNFLINNSDIIVAPLDSFRIVIKARLKNVRIQDMAGNVVYEGSIPKQGYVYSVISIQNLEDPIFTVLTNGRYSRVIQPCDHTYPELIGGPMTVLYGNGNSNRDHVAGIYSFSPDPAYIFVGSISPGEDAHAYVLKSGSPPINVPFINGTVLQAGGEFVDPTMVIKSHDLGVLVFNEYENTEYNARAYDLQPFLECLVDMRYFGTYSGWSFFERLENSGYNHDEYFELAKSIQEELGMSNGQPYPIGLVSFMIPHRMYDEKLYGVFLTLHMGVVEGISSVDYNFLNYYFNGNRVIQDNAYRMWGISYAYPEDRNTVLGDPNQIPFFIDRRTAISIFGQEGACDLLVNYPCS